VKGLSIITSVHGNKTPNTMSNTIQSLSCFTVRQFDE